MPLTYSHLTLGANVIAARQITKVALECSLDSTAPVICVMWHDEPDGGMGIALMGTPHKPLVMRCCRTLKYGGTWAAHQVDFPTSGAFKVATLVQWTVNVSADDLVARLDNKVEIGDKVSGRLAPAKHLLDTFALALTDGVTCPACCPPGDGRAARVVLGDMWGHAIDATRRDKPGRVVGLRRLHVDHQAMPVVREQVPQIAKHRAGVATLTERVRLTVAARLMRLVATLLAVPILALASTASRRRIVVGFVLAHEALMARPRLNQRAVDAEVLAGEMTARMRRLYRLVEQTRDDVAREQSVAVLAERRVVPHRIVHRQADKPTKQSVVGNLLHQHALAANRIQHLQQQRANQLLGRDARPAAPSRRSRTCERTRRPCASERRFSDRQIGRSG